MGSTYIPVQPTDIFPDFDTEKLLEFIQKQGEKFPQKDTSEYLLEKLSLSAEKIKSHDIFTRNYIYCTLVTRKHLTEIEERLKLIKQRKNQIGDKESYSYRKLKYFEKKNNDAKQQIIDFICYGMIKYICENSNSDLIDQNNEEKMWLLGPTYDYQFNSKYYNPDYDFSSFAKFYNIPDVPLIRFVENIEETIELKSRSIDSYYAKVRETAKNNDMLSKMVDRIGKNYHMHQRREIFESLLHLFNEKKYLAFVVNASIQIEGMFYELVSIKYGKKEKQGTLVEKVDKSFASNQILKHTLYPYFSFDVPELRNQVAHKGLVETDNIEMLAYEMILDLNCIVSLVEKESIDKYKTALIIQDKLNEVDYNNFDTEEEYDKNLSENFLTELYRQDKLNSPFFWDIMIIPEQFDDELNFYIPDSKDNSMIYLKDIVYAESNLLKKEQFWQTVLNSCEYIKMTESGLNDFGQFVEKIKNVFISKLNDESKKLCCKVNAKIQQIKAQENK